MRAIPVYKSAAILAKLTYLKALMSLFRQRGARSNTTVGKL